MLRDLSISAKNYTNDFIVGEFVKNRQSISLLFYGELESIKTNQSPIITKTYTHVVHVSELKEALDSIDEVFTINEISNYLNNLFMKNVNMFDLLFAIYPFYVSQNVSLIMNASYTHYTHYTFNTENNQTLGLMYTFTFKYTDEQQICDCLELDGKVENIYHNKFITWKTVDLLEFDFHETNQDRIQEMFNRLIGTYEGSLSPDNLFDNLKKKFIPPLKMNHTVIDFILHLFSFKTPIIDAKK